MSENQPKIEVIKVRKLVDNNRKIEIVEKIRILLECLLCELVESPDYITVSVLQGEKTTIFKVNCSKDCISRVLGKEGRMINSIRVIILGMTANHGFRSVVEIPYYSK